MKKITVTVLAALLLITALVSCSTNTAATERRVTVSGTGTVTLVPDMVTFSVNVSETAKTTSLAQQAANAKMAAILTILRNYNIADEDIVTSGLSFSSDYRWTDSQEVKVGERVSQTLSVRLRDLDSFSKLVDELGTVSGISLNSVNFASSKYEEAAVKARQLAYQNAHDKALVYAMVSGMSLGAPVSISDGYDTYGSVRNFAVAEAKSTAAMAMDYATEVPTGQLSVTINVNVEFSIN